MSSGGAPPSGRPPAVRTPLVRLVVSLLLLAIAAAWWLGARGRRYDSLDGFLSRQAEAGWVSVGRFGDAWPARVVEDRQAYGEISFRTADGQPHTYAGFAGYDLRVVHLRGPDGAETVVVLRSREPTGVVGDPLRE